MPITRLSAATWTANSGTTPGPITAPLINTLAVPGEFDADLNLQGGVAKTPDLGSARLGPVNDGTWDINGSVRTVSIASTGANFGGVTVNGGINAFAVTAGNLTADVTAGIIGSFRVSGTMSGNLHTNGNLNSLTVGSLTGSLVTVGTTDDLTAAAAGTIGTATLNAVRVTGRATSVFSDSEIVADHIGSVTTGQVNAASATPEGVAATTIKSAAIGVDGGTVRLNTKELATNATVTTALAGKTLGTFVVDII